MARRNPLPGKAAPQQVTHADHDHERCVADALHAAEQICSDRGVRLTPNRRRVLELAWHSHDVISAYDLLAELQKDIPSTKPPTVYRALDFLLKQGLIHRIESLNGFTRCEEPACHGVCQFLICDACTRVQELHSSALSKDLMAAAAALGFQSKLQTIEVHGLCSNCAS